MVGIGVAALLGVALLAKGGGDDGGTTGSTQRFGQILGSPMPGETGGTGGVTYQFPQESFTGFEKLNLWQPDWEVDKDPGQGRVYRGIGASSLPSKKQVSAAMGGVPSEAPASVRHMLGAAQLRKSGYSPGSGVVTTKKKVGEPAYTRSQAYRSGRVKVGKGMGA